MLRISQFVPSGLRICGNYRDAFPALNIYTFKFQVLANEIKDIENHRKYSTQIFHKHGVKSPYSINPLLPKFINTSSSAADATGAHVKRRSRKWKYVLGLAGLLGGIFFYYTSEDDDETDEPTNCGLRAPSKPSDITKDWIEYMLTEHENQNSKGSKVVVDSFDLSNAIKLGEGLNSQLQKIDVQARVQNVSGPKSTSLDKEYHVMVKMRVRSNAMTEAMNKFIDSELKELTIYSDVIPELNKFQKMYGGEFGIKVPNFLYGKFTNKESVLVIENLKPAGYKPHSMKREIDLNHAKVVIENLAKLHAVSYSYNKSNNFLDKFPCFNSEDKMSWFNTFMNAVSLLDNTIKLLELKNDKDLNKLALKIEKSKANLHKRLTDVVRDTNSKKVLCLTHNDCHSSNLLFKYGDDNEENQTIDNMQFVDWQLTNWDSPVIDLQYFFSISTTHEFRKAHLETLLEHYHSIFTQATTKMGTPVSHWTYEEFKEEYRRFEIYGLLRGLMVTQFVQSKFSEFYQRDALAESEVNQRMRRMNSILCNYLWHKFYTSQNWGKMIMKLNALVLYSIRKEIVSGTNPILNDRILGLVLDADEQGLFEDDLPSSVT
ncbi:unnamed protein product [Meganyctiphanes norvegica]|uniref:CHK kinase-like domain-containing protein n=1 Tax=Meganyctiphanes norvegica TaxID=48144 RepID=A0AAV2RA56_MEGNR